MAVQLAAHAFNATSVVSTAAASNFGFVKSLGATRLIEDAMVANAKSPTLDDAGRRGLDEDGLLAAMRSHSTAGSYVATRSHGTAVARF